MADLKLSCVAECNTRRRHRQFKTCMLGGTSPFFSALEVNGCQTFVKGLLKIGDSLAGCHLLLSSLPPLSLMPFSLTPPYTSHHLFYLTWKGIQEFSDEMGKLHWVQVYAPHKPDKQVCDAMPSGWPCFVSPLGLDITQITRGSQGTSSTRMEFILHILKCLEPLILFSSCIDT